jgi:adenylate cyclase
MAESWLVRVYNNRGLAVFKECAGPLELGRQDNRVPEELYHFRALAEGGCRVAIAPSDDLKISRRHARVDEIAADRVVVRNTSENNSLVFEDGYQLRPGRERESDLPVVLRFGAQVVRIQPATPEEAGRAIRSLDEPTAAPGERTGKSVASTLGLGSAAPELRNVFAWMRTLIEVLQCAARDDDFFRLAARAVVENAGLDIGRVLTRQGDGWKTAAFHPAEDAEYEQSNPPSRLIINRVCGEKKASWFDPMEEEDCKSLAGVSSVVAAPVLARSGTVIAILYGERRSGTPLAAASPVSQLDAMLMEVLAVGLAAGLARAAQERAALALQTQFEQFFTPELARLLTAQPNLLEGKDSEITVLFCDIRGFSRITRRQTPAFTVEWTQDVLSTLSECVLAHHGVLVDYIGDEVVAMWGAPEQQPDHAERACRAALDMISSLAALNGRWQDRLGEPIGLGIGINTGPARVGNTGSRRKFKYGPLGDTVNVASRIQGAAKYFKSSLVVTRETRDRLGSGFQLRCLGRARVMNIIEPIELFELRPPDQPDSGEVCAEYEAALAAFETREFRKATSILGRLVSDHGDDGPSFALLARAIACFVDEPEAFDPAFRLPGK